MSTAEVTPQEVTDVAVSEVRQPLTTDELSRPARFVDWMAKSVSPQLLAGHGDADVTSDYHVPLNTSSRSAEVVEYYHRAVKHVVDKVFSLALDKS